MMAKEVTVSLVTQTTPEGERFEAINNMSSLGPIVGMLAAIVGIVMGGGNSLIPMPGIERALLHESSYITGAAIFLGLMAFSLILQIRGISKLRGKLASNYGMVVYGTIITAIFTVGVLISGAVNITLEGQIAPWTVDLMTFGGLFVIFWQLFTVVLADSLKTWVGLLAGILNAVFIPVMAIGQVFVGSGIVYVAYGILFLAQFFTVLFWWSPESDIREYTRTADIGKIGFGLTGILTFAIGSFAIFIGPFTTISNVAIWQPWGTMITDQYFVTNPGLIYAFMAMLVYWVAIFPRLGAKELRIAHVRDDVLKGGAKWFLVAIAALGVHSAGQAGSELAITAINFFFVLPVLPAIILILVGSLYVSNSDIITGLPLLLVGLVMIIHPFSMAFLMLIAWSSLLISQCILFLETIKRGFTSFSSGFLTLIAIGATSIFFIVILLGGLGSGPAALWPTNKWFNVGLFANVPMSLQAGTILALPVIVLLIRNMAIGGFAHLQGYSGRTLMGLSFLFAIMVPLIAGSDIVTHQANIGAAVFLALYTISFVLVLSFNLNLAGDLEENGNDFEGALIRMTTIIGMIVAAIVMMVVLGTFAGTAISTAVIGNVIALLITFIVGLEILLDIGWFVAGIRLGLFKHGFKFMSMEEAQATAPTVV
ncbi:MAG: hypothetical protein RTU30_11220 [Candidatus Thorarchaeota archaeon]